MSFETVIVAVLGLALHGLHVIRLRQQTQGTRAAVKAINEVEGVTLPDPDDPTWRLKNVSMAVWQYPGHAHPPVEISILTYGKVSVTPPDRRRYLPVRCLLFSACDAALSRYGPPAPLDVANVTFCSSAAVRYADAVWKAYMTRQALDAVLVDQPSP